MTAAPHCLVTDDSRVIRTVAKLLLAAEGFAVSEARDGAEALDRCREHMPDLVLVDGVMPVMNGIDFLQVLRRDPGGDAPAIVFMTEDHSEARIRQALSAGADEVLLKPFDEDALRARLRLLGFLSASARIAPANASEAA